MVDKMVNWYKKSEKSPMLINFHSFSLIFNLLHFFVIFEVDSRFSLVFPRYKKWIAICEHCSINLAKYPVGLFIKQFKLFYFERAPINDKKLFFIDTKFMEFLLGIALQTSIWSSFYW